MAIDAPALLQDWGVVGCSRRRLRLHALGIPAPANRGCGRPAGIPSAYLEPRRGRRNLRNPRSLSWPGLFPGVAHRGVDSFLVFRQPLRDASPHEPTGTCSSPRSGDMSGHRLLTTRHRVVLLGLALVLGLMPQWQLGAAAPSARPEDVGVSTERLQRIGELAHRNIAAGNFSGAVTLVARNGRIVHHEAYGLMDLESKKPMVKDGIFRIMSMTKPVIGVAVLMMMEEGKVRLQDPISKFIPEWRNMTVAVPLPPLANGRGGNAAQPPPAAGGAGGRGAQEEPRYYTVPVERDVTIRDLLTHTSGLVSGPISQSANRAVAAGPRETLADYLPRLGKVPLEFRPGARWAYSATAGFDVLSRVVEVTSGMTIDRFVKQRIFDPLQMKDTTYMSPAGNPRLTKLYSRSADGLRPAPDPAFMN